MTHAGIAATPLIEFQTLAEHRGYLLKIARMELRDQHLAEDCVSDAITQAYEKRASFRGDSSLRTWLTTILKNRIVDLLRKEWREQPLDAPADEQGHLFDRLFVYKGRYLYLSSKY